MLVLSRKANQSIQIGDNVVVTVVRIAGGEVRIGIEAPAHVPIVRRELTGLSATQADRRPLTTA